jgi:protein-L-isoaspartate(D-aspartate) O-methyltransferase
MLTAAPERVPTVLLEQLRPGGRMVLPVGPPDTQKLTVIDKDARGGIQAREIIPVRFSSLETVI